jgi:hypothetical protein
MPKHNTHGFEEEVNEHDVVDKVYSDIKPRVKQSEWVVKLKNQAGEEWKSRCTEHYAWKAAEYIQELENTIMSDYQIQHIDRRLQYIEEKLKDWEKVIDILMADPSFMHTLGVKELQKNRNRNPDTSYKVKDPYRDI